MKKIKYFTTAHILQMIKNTRLQCSDSGSNREDHKWLTRVNERYAL